MCRKITIIEWLNESSRKIGDCYVGKLHKHNIIIQVISNLFNDETTYLVNFKHLKNKVFTKKSILNLINSKYE